MCINIFFPRSSNSGCPRSPPASRNNGRRSASNGIFWTGSGPIPRQYESVLRGLWIKVGRASTGRGLRDDEDDVARLFVVEQARGYA